MRIVRLLATGGTIASREGAAGRDASATASELVEQTRVPDHLRVSTEDVVGTLSSGLQPGNIRTLLERIDEAFTEATDGDGADGIVVTHGTDAMEEVAFLVSLLHDDPRPVIFTGAQRPFDDPAPDGPANLADALAVACSPLARGRGTLVCFDGLVFPARGVTKVDTLAAHAFDAPGRGPELRVADGTVRELTAAHPPTTIPLPLERFDFPRVDVVPLYVAADQVALQAAVDAGARGIVLAAFGAGNGTPAITAAASEAIADGVVVVVTSRVPAGPVVPLYSSGGGADLHAAGAVFAGDLSPWQARVLLAMALAAAPHDPEPLIREYLERGSGLGASGL